MFKRMRCPFERSSSPFCSASQRQIKNQGFGLALAAFSAEQPNERQCSVHPPLRGVNNELVEQKISQLGLECSNWLVSNEISDASLCPLIELFCL